MDKKNEIIRNPWVRILGSVALLALCFIVNRTMNMHGARNVANIVRIVTIPVIGFALIQIIKGISMLILQKDNEKPPKSLPTEPIKIWNHEELFSYLEKEIMVDLIIGSDNPIKISISCEYIRPYLGRKGYFTNKVFFINEKQYSSFDEFKQNFVLIHPEQEIRIMSATVDDGLVDVRI